MPERHRVLIEDSKGGEKKSHPIVEAKLLFAHEQHNGDGGRQRFRQRSQIKDRARMHGTARGNERTRAERELIDNLVSLTHEQHGSRKHSLSHSFFKGVFDRLEVHGFISKLRPKKIPES